MTVKKYFLIAFLSLFITTINAQGIKHYIPQGDYTLNPQVPSPKEFLGFEVGEHHISHDLLISYMRALSKSSDRVIAKEIGTTYEGRPLIFMIITSAENQKNLDKIKERQLMLTDPSKSSSLPIKEMPLVMWFGYSVHGNEASGVNASMAVAYYLAAAQGAEVDKILKNSVIIIQPAQNPDGINRFADWVNSSRSYSYVLDQFSREFREPAPSGRSNHYWFDLNRDWLPVQHPETRHRLKIFMDWHPTLVNDYHEQGSTNGTYFSPGIKNSTNPLAPELNRKLTEDISLYHAKAMNEDGVLFFTKEGYDNFYTGKGASYPDMLGAIGILYEQPSSRGHIQSRNGVLLKFTDIIRYQALCTYSAINAGIDKREELNRFKADSYRESQDMARKGAVKGYVISAGSNISLIKELNNILSAHSINLYELQRDITINGKSFNSKNSYVLPLAQREYRLIRTLFDKTTSYIDTTFYDVSAWTLPLAMNIIYQELLSTEGLVGEKVVKVRERIRTELPLSKLAYLFELSDLYSYKILYDLLNRGVAVRVGDKPLRISIGDRELSLSAGAIMVPVRGQQLSEAELHKVILQHSQDSETDIYSATSSFGVEFDLGSAHFKRVSIPKIALIVGRGVSYGSMGELWHLLDQKYSIPASIIDASLLSEIDLNQYNTIVLSGNYRLPKEVNDKLKNWSLMSSNAIIAIDQSFNTLNEIGITDIKERSPGVENISGVILKATFSNESPIFYGVSSNELFLFKRGRTIISESVTPGSTVAKYADKPLKSGYLPNLTNETIKGMPAILAGNGVIYFCDAPNFRGYWYGASRLFINSLFFRELIPSTKIQTK
ncbi:MAG: hypothetical protein CVU13_03295 [Bacteroidetes bacterium HGW-Bacteroidetes-8]|jgi:hypothetical protein|nr:MAG: hypothetical protein CVU13_03295 [Bacteroidetes bacterium HGW-Bacteroidetes-8]